MILVALAAALLGGGTALIRVGYPLPGAVLTGAGAWLGIWWTTT